MTHLPVCMMYVCLNLQIYRFIHLNKSYFHVCTIDNEIRICYVYTFLPMVEVSIGSRAWLINKFHPMQKFQITEE